MTEPASGLVYGHYIGGNKPQKQATWRDVNSWQPGQGVLWVHLDATNETAMNWLQHNSGLSTMLKEALLELGTRPRSVAAESGMLVIFRGVNCNPGADPEDMVAIRMFITEQRIITMRRNRVRAIQDVHETLLSGNGPTTVGEFFVAVVDHITDRIGDIVVDIEDRVTELEDTVVSAETAELRPRLAELRRESISLRRYIAPQRDMLSLIVQGELNSRLSEQMNRAMYTLSIVAAIFLPLGLLTGLLGINVGGIPGTESPWAFFIVTVFLILMAIFLIAWFKRIKWL